MKPLSPFQAVVAILIGLAAAWFLFEPIMAARAAVPVLGDMAPRQLAVLVGGVLIVLIGLLVAPAIFRRLK